jgi:hypothetical protein
MISDEQFTKLYKNGFARTCDYFHKKGFSPEDSQDLAQEVFLLVWRWRKHYKSEFSLVSYWWLKVNEISYKISRGKFSDPMDELIKVRNSDYRGQYIIDAQEDPSPHPEQEIWMDQLVSLVPELLGREIRLLLEDLNEPDLSTREKQKRLGVTRRPYERIMKEIFSDPKIKELIRAELEM